MRWTLPSLLSMAVMAVALSLIVIVMVRRITRPMAELAAAAERLGRGEALPAIDEQWPARRPADDPRLQPHARSRCSASCRTGPACWRRSATICARRSHSLRLRAEFVEDEETRAKILETLDEMQRMTEATLAFAREEAATEETRIVDLAALVESVCADLGDIGQDVTFTGPDRVPYRLPASQPEAGVAQSDRERGHLRRACPGRLEAGADELRIVIEDDGPGIPETEVERVFAPFVRLEESRSLETGGIGLGMAIARSIVRRHGGDIGLANRPEGGLRVGHPAAAGGSHAMRAMPRTSLMLRAALETTRGIVAVDRSRTTTIPCDGRPEFGFPAKNGYSGI